MSPRLWRFRLEDMLAAVVAVKTYTEDLDAVSFEANRLVVDAVLHNLAIIGEAAANVPEEICDLAPEIPWPDIRGMRNIVVHEYFGVSLPIVWQTVVEDLPILHEALLRLLDTASESGNGA